MTHLDARRIRRVGFAVSAWVGTIAAHIAAVGEVQLTAMAPLVLLAAAALTAALPVGRREFRPRGPIRATVLLAAGELSVHVAMSAAPGLFGMHLHATHGPPVTLGALIAHGVVALHLGVLLAFFDLFLARAVRVAAAIRRLLRATARLRRGLPPLAVRDRTCRVVTRAHTVLRGRGPPTSLTFV